MPSTDSLLAGAVVNAGAYTPDAHAASAGAFVPAEVLAEIRRARVQLYCGQDIQAVAEIRAAREQLRWKLYSTGLNKGGPRSSYAIMASGSNIFKGTYQSGLYLSTDKGQSWNPSNNGIPLDLTSGMMVSVTQLVQNPTTLYALTDLGVRYSTDKGKSWNKPTHNGINRLGYMTALAVSGGNLYTGIAISQKGVFLSTDNGNNWKPAGLEGKEVTALLTAPNGVVYAGVPEEVYRSADNGKTWTAVGKGLPTGKQIYSIGLTPDGRLLAGVNRGGIYLLK